MRPPSGAHGRALRAIRGQRGLTQAAVGKLAGLAGHAISLFERRESPNLGRLLRVFSALGCEVVIRDPQTGQEWTLNPQDYPETGIVAGSPEALKKGKRLRGES